MPETLKAMHRVIRGKHPDGKARGEPIHETCFSSVVMHMLLGSHEPLSIVDVGAGKGGAFDTILAMGDVHARRCHCVAVEPDPAARRILEARKDRHFAILGNFASHQCELDTYARLNVSHDLVVCHNTMHHVEPMSVSKFVGDLLGLAKPGGRVLIIDMQVLPIDAPEACALTWTQEEIEQIITAGCPTESLIGTTHTRRVPVFEVQVGRTSAAFDYVAAHARAMELLWAKHCALVATSGAAVDDVRFQDDPPDEVQALQLIEVAARNAYMTSRLHCVHGIPCNYRLSALNFRSSTHPPTHA